MEALLLKGTALLELKKITDSISHYREAMRLEPHRYEAHKGEALRGAALISQRTVVYIHVGV